MSRRLTIVLGFTLAAAVIAGAALTYWNRGPAQRPDVSARLAAAAARPDGGTIDLSEHATFAWTDVYVVPPYTTKEAVKARMGVSWPWRWNRIEHRDGISLLVFVDSSRITGIVEHPRNQGDFVSREGIQHFTKANAVFSIGRRDDSHILLRPAIGTSK